MHEDCKELGREMQTNLLNKIDRDEIQGEEKRTNINKNKNKYRGRKR